MSGKRVLLLAAAGSLCATAGLAISILLFSEFGPTQGRILGTTAAIGFYGLLALPAGILADRATLRRLAGLVLVLAGVGFALALAALWITDPPEELINALVSASVFTVASTQTAALATRRSPHDPRSVHWLFVASIMLIFTAASMLAAGIWSGTEREGYFRALGAIAVADVLAVALQPILARLRSRDRADLYELRLQLEPERTLDLEIEASTFARAVAQAVTIAEREGRVLRIELVESGSPRGSENGRGAPVRAPLV